MLDQGYISQEEHDEALEDNVYDRIQIVDNSTSSTANVNSYFVDTLTDQVMDDLINELGYTETQAFNALYGGGLTIYSTQNTNLQQICDEEVNNLDNYNGQVEYSFSYRLSIQKADGTLQNYSEQTMLTYYREKTGNTGFLGAGKTTFLRQYVRYLVAQGHNVCILENDFGAVNVDAMLVQEVLGPGCDVETISGGCDCDTHQRRVRTKLIAMAMRGFDRVSISLMAYLL